MLEDLGVGLRQGIFLSMTRSDITTETFAFLDGMPA